MLKKELALYERDESGKLIPQEVPLLMVRKDLEEYPQYNGETIAIIPIPRGVLKKMFGFSGKVEEEVETDKDSDAEIVVEYCKNPVFTMEELTYAKPVIVRSIVRTILAESGVKIDDTAGTKRIEDNDEFGKNS